MLGFRNEASSHSSSWDAVDDEICSKSGVEDALECPVCWEGFNSGCNLPYVLWCGHSLCKSCLLGLQWAMVKFPVVPVQLPLFISCPWCQFLSCRLVWKGKLKYPCKNFFLLWLVESLRSDFRHLNGALRGEGKWHAGAVLGADTQQIRCGVADAAPLLAGESSSGTEQPWNVLSLHGWIKKVVGVCVHLMVKFMLLMLVSFILFCVLPFSTIILVMYFMGTLLFAFPSFLMVYFAFPSVSWLLREIVT